MNLLIRTDASVVMGTGHVMRCLALAQAWQDAGGRAIFATCETPPAIRARLAAEGCAELSITGSAGTSFDASRTSALAREYGAGWIVVDGYQFNADYQHTLGAAGFKVLFVDDFGHASHYSADLVLNQNVSAKAEAYSSREPKTRLLLGPRYCLLRREFSAWLGPEREIPEVCRRILVMMGGSDPENLTERVIKALALADISTLEISIVIGGGNPHAERLEAHAAESGLKIMLRKDPQNIAELMAQADVAVSAAGSTCWELCRMGLPALLIDVAENQTALATELERRGCALHAGDKSVPAEKIARDLQRLLGSHELRVSLSQKSRRLVDGKGARRVVSALRGTPALCFRQARPEDSRLLFEWANDAEVRAASFSSDPIPWETHVAWFGEKLGNAGIPGREQCAILIAEDEVARPIGQIRFETFPHGGWEVGVSLDRLARGFGLGSTLISLGVREFLRDCADAPLHAFVKPTNTASVKAFQEADFKIVGTEQTRGQQSIHLIYGAVQPPNR